MAVLLLFANVLLLQAECAVIHVACIAQYYEYRCTRVTTRIEQTRDIVIDTIQYISTFMEMLILISFRNVEFLIVNIIYSNWLL